MMTFFAGIGLAVTTIALFVALYYGALYVVFKLIELKETSR